MGHDLFWSRSPHSYPGTCTFIHDIHFQILRGGGGLEGPAVLVNLIRQRSVCSLLLHIQVQHCPYVNLEHVNYGPHFTEAFRDLATEFVERKSHDSSSLTDHHLVVTMHASYTVILQALDSVAVSVTYSVYDYAVSCYTVGS